MFKKDLKELSLLLINSAFHLAFLYTFNSYNNSFHGLNAHTPLKDKLCFVETEKKIRLNSTSVVPAKSQFTDIEMEICGQSVNLLYLFTFGRCVIVMDSYVRTYLIAFGKDMHARIRSTDVVVV